MTLFVVMGPPCSGKSTWIMERATAEDVVIDLDRIAVALSGPGAPTHGHEGLVDKLASMARTVAIDHVIREKAYEDANVYLIHSTPNPAMRGRYRRIGAELVVLDPGLDVVTERVKATRPAASMRGVEKWYRMLQVREERGTPRSSRRWS